MFYLDVESAVTERLEEEATSLAAHLAAATCRWLLVVAELDRREAWRSWECRSMAHWLSWRCGVGPRTARAHLVVAHALGGLPAVRTAFEAGELSFSQVRAICRVADAGNEASLVELARHATATQLERVVRASCGALAGGNAGGDVGPDAKTAAELHCGVGEDGCWELTVRGLPVEQGLAIEAALRLVVERHREQGGPAGPLPLPVRRAEALVEMAEIVRHVDEAGLPVSTGDGCQVLVVADEHGCHLDHGPGLPDDAGRRLSCDASVVLLRMHDGQPLDIGRKARTIPPSIRRALEHRDGGCRFPACNRRAFTQGHHLVHWTRGGVTSLANLLLLCHHHHRLVHEGGWRVSGHPAAGVDFHAPDGRVVTQAPPRRAYGPDLRARHRQRGLAIDATTAVSRWAGERLDLDAAVDAVVLTRTSGSAVRSPS